jgi:hypothetical protein
MGVPGAAEAREETANAAGPLIGPPPERMPSWAVMEAESK